MALALRLGRWNMNRIRVAGWIRFDHYLTERRLGWLVDLHDLGRRVSHWDVTQVGFRCLLGIGRDCNFARTSSI